MKINNNFRIQNPVLHYKLDPGEPGLATPARASQSIARVATHEATNIRRFRREAMEKGGVVVYSFISLYMEQRGAFLAATAGKSSAIVIIPAKEQKRSLYSTVKKDDDNSFYELNDKNKLENNEKNRDENNKINPIQNNTIVDEIEQINNVIERLKTEKATLEGQLTENNNVIVNNNNEANNTYKENRLDEIENKIHYLEQKKELEKQKQYFSNLVNTKNLSLKLAGLNYNNLNFSINGSFFDITI